MINSYLARDIQIIYSYVVLKVIWNALFCPYYDDWVIGILMSLLIIQETVDGQQ